MKYFVLDENNNVVPCSLLDWGKLYSEQGNDRRRVAKDDIDDKYISTVFLGLDHGGNTDSEPALFETMVFHKGIDIFCARYSTWEEAAEGHKKVIEWVNSGCIDDDDDEDLTMRR